MTHTADVEMRNQLVVKSLEELNSKELAWAHLCPALPTVQLRNGHLFSSLFYLTEMLSATFNNRRTTMYGPIFCSFSILDQIGTLYEPVDRATKYGAGIKRALAFFSSNVSDAEIAVLYSIRNGIFHDGSMVSLDNRGNKPALKKGNHIVFRITSECGEPLLTPPEKKWDGLFHDDLTPHITWLNVRKLKEVVEECIGQWRILLHKDKLRISAARAEFFYKYLFFSNSPGALSAQVDTLT